MSNEDLKIQSNKHSKISDSNVSEVDSQIENDDKRPFPTPMEEPIKIFKVQYMGSTTVKKPTGVEILNDAIELLSRNPEYKSVTVSIAPSTITISDDSCQFAECRVRFLSFLGIGKDPRNCGFIVHTSNDDLVAHAFLCEPSSATFCKTVEAACKLRYQKCLDAHGRDGKPLPPRSKGIKDVFDNFISGLK